MVRLYNTLTRRKQTLRPLTPGVVRLYTCGLTVYSQPHIGNWVGYIYWDVLIRLLQWHGLRVVRTQNITDVGHLTSDADDGEDKLQKGARREGTTAWQVAAKYSAIAEREAYSTLRLLRPDYLVPATDYISQQIAFVRDLEAKGYTYVIEGDGVYFDTSRLDDYGRLARLDIKGLAAGARVSVAGKRTITDFALWKFSPPARSGQRRDMEWDSPWGMGFPGWHLECSTIARQTLGDQIDIHTGGIDHIPVHHSNEIAQTESLTGRPFAQIWLHNNHIKVDSRKMSKSAGNIITLTDVTDRGFSPMAFKLAILSKHYQTEGNFTWQSLRAAQRRLNHWRGYAALRHQTHDTLTDDDAKVGQERSAALMAAPQAIITALDDDLDTPTALALIDEAFAQLDGVRPEVIQHHALVQFLEVLDDLFGLQLLASTPDIDDATKAMILQRQRARDQHNWAESDRLRNLLVARAGIQIDDTPHGPIWHYANPAD